VCEFPYGDRDSITYGVRDPSRHVKASMAKDYQIFFVWVSIWRSWLICLWSSWLIKTCEVRDSFSALDTGIDGERFTVFFRVSFHMEIMTHLLMEFVTHHHMWSSWLIFCNWHRHGWWKITRFFSCEFPYGDRDTFAYGVCDSLTHVKFVSRFLQLTQASMVNGVHIFFSCGFTYGDRDSFAYGVCDS